VLFFVLVLVLVLVLLIVLVLVLVLVLGSSKQPPRTPKNRFEHRSPKEPFRVLVRFEYEYEYEYD
jgi:hypothetical protein